MFSLLEYFVYLNGIAILNSYNPYDEFSIEIVPIWLSAKRECGNSRLRRKAEYVCADVKYRSPQIGVAGTHILLQNIGTRF